MKPRKREFLYGALGILVALGVSIEIGELAARHVMTFHPPGGLHEAALQRSGDRPAAPARMSDHAWAAAIAREGLAPLPTVRIATSPVAPTGVPSRPAASGLNHQAPMMFAAPNSPPSPVERMVHVEQGDTLLDVLERAGANDTEAHNAASAVATVFDPRSLKPGQVLRVMFRPGDDGELIRFSLPASYDRTVKVRRGVNDSFSAEQVARPLNREVVLAKGTIHSSLYEDAVAAGLPPTLVVEMIRAFSYDVDFQREIQQGDRFEAAFERFTDRADEVLHNGNLVMAALTLSGRTLRIYRYVSRDGRVDYYNDRGESVRKALLRTPIDGARITSGFGMRIHPILGYSMMHKGIDFGAPIGTPIMAAGAGTIERAGWNGGYGNYVKIKHNAQYSTAYGHMSRIAAGIHKGVHVRQGEVIGYVGETGRATGPHLHYEVLVHDKQVNPAGVKLMPGTRLAGAELKSFEAARGKIDRELASLPPALKLARSTF